MNALYESISICWSQLLRVRCIGGMKLMYLPDPSLQRSRIPSALIQLSLVCTSVDVVKVSWFALQQDPDHRWHECGPLPVLIQILDGFHWKYSRVTMLTTHLSCVAANSETQHFVNHLLTYFCDMSQTLEGWLSCNNAKGNPWKKRSWCYFLDWVYKEPFPIFFKKIKYISSLKPVAYMTSIWCSMRRLCNPDLVKVRSKWV